MGTILLLIFSLAGSAVGNTEVYRAEPKKTQVYIREGVIEGGSETVQSVFISNIRRSKNADFERVVLDVDSKQIPSFHISVEPNQKRLLITIKGNAKTSYDAPHVLGQFKKSLLIEKVELFPKLDEQHWTFSIRLKREVPVEAFTLSEPGRIVVDLKSISVPVTRTKAISEEMNTETN